MIRRPASVGWVAAAAAIFLLSPFFFLGRDSAMGWYDETDATIPWTTLYSSQPGHTFIHEWAGGIGTRQNFLQGNERVSLLGVLLKLGDPQVAALTCRLLFILALLGGTYLGARRIFGASPRVSEIGAVFCLVSTPINYGWIISAGSAWVAAFLAWLALAVTSKTRAARWGHAAVTAAIIGFTGNPFFMLMCVPVFLVSLRMLLGPNRLDGYGCLVTAAAMCAVVLANYFPQIVDFFSYLQSSSARFQHFGGMGADSAPRGTAIASLVAYFDVKIHLLTTLGVVIIIVASARRPLLDAGRRLLAYLGVFAMCAALITIAAVFPDLAISHLRWEVPFICASVVGAWVVAQSLSATQVAPGISFASWRIAAAVAVIAVNSFLLVRATISNLSVSGGWGQLSGYSELERLRDANSPIRVVSMPYSSPSAAIAPVLGVDAFDGMSAGFSVRRTMFFQQLLQADPNRPVHTHRQGLAASAAPELIQALRIANVGAILSTSLEDVDDLPVSFEIHGRSLQLPAAGDAIYPVLGIDGGAIHVVPTLRVWRIADPWQRWFIAKSAVASRYPLRNPEYWRELLRQPIDSALFAVDEVPAATGFMRSDPAAVLVSGSKTANGFALQTNGLQSVVVINQVFDDFWNAQCDRKPLPVFPVNGIMFAVFAPDGCRELSITRRP